MNDSITITIRFYQELSFFIPKYMNGKRVEKPFPKDCSVKHAIETFGVPHTEVDLILVNEKPVTFDYNLQNGDDVSVYPVFESFDISETSRLQQSPLRNTKFIADVHLKKLTTYLRLCGFDTAYQPDLDDAEIADKAYNENRIILTRDRDLLKRKKVTHGYYIKSQNPARQLKDVINRFQLKKSIKPFTRCSTCNGKVVSVEKQKIINKLPPATREEYSEFYTCSNCGKVYWMGAHYKNLIQIIHTAQEA